MRMLEECMELAHERMTLVIEIGTMSMLMMLQTRNIHIHVHLVHLAIQKALKNAKNAMQKIKNIKKYLINFQK